MKSILMLAFIFAIVSTSAGAGSFYPACLKKDGDWLEGVTRKECVGKDVRGQWVTGKTRKRRPL